MGFSLVDKAREGLIAVLSLGVKLAMQNCVWMARTVVGRGGKRIRANREKRDNVPRRSRARDFH